MANTTQQIVGVPIGENNTLVQGTLITNKNGDAEWYQGTGLNRSFNPTFTSNKSNNYQWQPSPNCTGGDCPTQEEIQRFYSTQSSTSTLNNARVSTFRSPTGFNSPLLAQQLGIPGARNTAQTSQSTSQQGGNSSSQDTRLTPGSALGTINKDKTDLTFSPASGLRYPVDIGSSNQDRIKFQAKRITGRNIPESSGTSGRLNFTLGEPTYESADGPVYIAIQAPISDQNGVEWGPDNMNPINAELYNQSMNFMGGDIDQELNTFLKGLYTTANEYQGRIQRYLGGQAASLNNILARTDAVVLNPNLELLFNGPTLRPFSFQFKMSARDPDEARAIKRIINYFKYHMSVRKEDQLFLKAPHVFDIQYQYGKNDADIHPGLNRIKTCALTNFSVDYTPLGSYMTYQDGTMVSYSLSMQFQEILPVYDEDYKGFDIGDNPNAAVKIGF